MIAGRRIPEESPAGTPDPGENMCCWFGEGSGTPCAPALGAGSVPGPL